MQNLLLTLANGLLADPRFRARSSLLQELPKFYADILPKREGLRLAVGFEVTERGQPHPGRPGDMQDFGMEDVHVPGHWRQAGLLGRIT